jgi:hypothetical protein
VSAFEFCGYGILRNVATWLDLASFIDGSMMERFWRQRRPLVI